MREIKFQVYDHKQKMMFDVIEISRLEHSSGYVKGRKGDSGGEYFVTEGYIDKNFALPNGKQIHRFNLREYTGLKDKNGKEIYEGDIVRAVALSNDHHQRGAITVSSVEYWNGNACLSITFTPIFPFIVDHEIEVIGNIYKHPHLLEAKA